MWMLINLHRLGDVLLCVVRWVHPDRPAKPFSLAEVSLTEAAVYWQYFGNAEAAQAEMKQRCAASATREWAARASARLSVKRPGFTSHRATNRRGACTRRPSLLTGVLPHPSATPLRPAGGNLGSDELRTAPLPDPVEDRGADARFAIWPTLSAKSSGYRQR